MARAATMLSAMVKIRPTTVMTSKTARKCTSIVSTLAPAPVYRFAFAQCVSVRHFAAATAVESLPGRPFGEITIGVPAEVLKGEKRVSQTPETVAQLVKKGYKVAVQSGAGSGR